MFKAHIFQVTHSFPVSVSWLYVYPPTLYPVVYNTHDLLSRHLCRLVQWIVALPFCYTLHMTCLCNKYIYFIYLLSFFHRLVCVLLCEYVGKCVYMSYNCIIRVFVFVYLFYCLCLHVLVDVHVFVYGHLPFCYTLPVTCSCNKYIFIYIYCLFSQLSPATYIQVRVI